MISAETLSTSLRGRVPSYSRTILRARRTPLDGRYRLSIPRRKGKCRVHARRSYRLASSSPSLKFCSFARCASITKPFPFAARMPRSFRAPLVARRGSPRARTVIFHSFPCCIIMRPIGRIPGIPRIFISRAGAHGVNSFDVFTDALPARTAPLSSPVVARVRQFRGRTLLTAGDEKESRVCMYVELPLEQVRRERGASQLPAESRDRKRVALRLLFTQREQRSLVAFSNEAGAHMCVARNNMTHAVAPLIPVVLCQIAPTLLLSNPFPTSYSRSRR